MVRREGGPTAAKEECRGALSDSSAALSGSLPKVRKPIFDSSVIVRRGLEVDLGEHHKCAFVERSSNCSAAPSGVE